MAVIALDLDGTMVSCQARQSAVLHAVSRRHGITVDTCRVWAMKREGASTHGALLEQGIPEECAKRVSAAWQASVEDPAWLTLDRRFDDTMPSLATLQARGISVIVLTARSRAHWVRPQLLRLGMTRYLASVCVVSSSNAATEKASVLRDAHPILVVGDTELDARAAMAATVPFHALDRGQRSRAFLERMGVESIFSSLLESVKRL